MRKVFLAEATAYDPKENKLVTVRMCSRGQGHIAFSDLPDAEYVPCITAPPQQTVSFNQDGIPGQIQVEYGTLGVSFARDLRNTHWRRFDFDGYPCRLLYGDAGLPYSSYTLVPGSKLGALESEENGGSFAIRGPEVDLTRDILTESYGGTGGADGREDRKGTLKPFAVGRFENWEAVLIDPVNLIYQFHGYGPAGDVSAVYENALTLGPARTSVRTYEELAALTAEQLPPGAWAKAPAVGMFRLGAEPYGKLTLDGVGALDGGVAHTGVASICAFMLRRFGGVPADKIDMASATRLDRSFPHMWGNCLDAQAKPDDAQDETIAYSVGDFVREAMAHVAGYLFATPDGVWHFGRNVSAKPPIALSQSRSSKPVVLSVGSPATSTRVQRVRVGGRRCFSTHSDTEISSALKDAVEEVATGIGVIGDKVEAVEKDIENKWKQLPDLVGPLLQKPIDDIAAVTIEYGAGLTKAQQALHKKNLVAIREIGTRVEEDGSKVAEEILQLTSRVSEAEEELAGLDIDGSIEAGLVEIRRTIANLEFASAEAVDTKIANYGKGVTAWQIEEERVRVEADEALAEDIEQLGVSFTKQVGEDLTKLEGVFNDFRRLLVDENGNITAVRQDELGVRLSETAGGIKTAYEAAIKVVDDARIEDGKAVAKNLETLQSGITVTDANGQPTSINSAIQTLRQAITDADGGESQLVINLQSRLDNFEGQNGAKLEQAFRTYANKTDGIGSQYTLKVQTDQNGQQYIAGMGIAIENGVSAIAFSADSFRILTPGQNPQQVFYADANGIYAPNLTVERLKADSIDNDALKRAAAAKTSWHILASQVACPRNVPTNVIVHNFNKLDSDSLLKVQMFSQTYNVDDLHFHAEILLDGVVRQTARVRMAFDNSNSQGEVPITPFAFIEGVPAGAHTVTFRITSNEYESPVYVRAGSTLEVTELRRASF